MPLIIPPGFAQGVMYHQQAGDAEPMLNTLGVDLGGISDFQLACDALSEWWGSEVVTGCMGADMSLTLTLLYVGQDGGAPLVVESIEGNTGGGQATTMLPSNSATLVRKRTGSAGKRGRGRLYLPGVAKPDVNDLGIIDGAVVASYQTSFDDFKTGFEAVAGGPSFCILHRSEGAGTEPPPTPITAFEVQSKIATQRRRLRP